MVKVLHILTRLIRGGADQNTLFTVEGLDTQRFDVDLLIGGDSAPDYVRQASQTVKLIYEPWLRRNVKPLSDLLALYKLYRHIKRGGYDIVHTHTAKAGVLGRLAAKLAGTPCIIHTVHGITFHEFRPPLVRLFYIFCERLSARYTDHFIAVGHDLKDYYLRHGIGSQDHYTVIYSGMDLTRFVNAQHLPKHRKDQKRREFHLSPQDVIIGNVSRLDIGKGQEYLLQAARQLTTRFPFAKFMFVGDGAFRERFERMTRELHLEHCVIFTGFRHDIEDMIALFDIAVMTSLWEGLPRTLVQYAVIGKPIVAFEARGVTELLKNELNGFTVPLKDMNRLTNRLAYLLEHPKEAKRMGNQGKGLIDQSWHVDAMVGRITQLYDTLIRTPEPKHIHKGASQV